MRRTLLTALSILLAALPLLAHGGGTDSQGGHNNRKAGNYHFHIGPLEGKTYDSKAAATAALASLPAPAKGQPVEAVANAPLTDFTGLERYVVSRVIDGDTVELLTPRGKAKVRLIGVDTPETVHPQKPVEYFGREASAFTKAFVLGDTVYVEYDQEPTDRYGRVLAYLYRSDGAMLNLEIVRQGYGHAYTRYPFRYMELFRKAEREAREEGRGMWGERQN